MPDFWNVYPQQTMDMQEFSEEIKSRLAEGYAIDNFLASKSVGLAIISCPDFIFRRANDTYRSFTPHPEIHPEGKHFNDIWPPEEGYGGTNGLRRVVETGEAISARRIEVHYASGPAQYLDARVERIFWEGKPAALTLISESGEEPGIEALRSSEERFAKAFRDSPDGLIISIKKDGRIVDVNQGFEQIFGYRQEEALGKTSVDLHLFPDMAVRNALLEEMEVLGSVRNIELAALTKAGDTRYVNMSMETITVGDQECLLKIIHDITEQKQLRESLQQAEASLLRMNQALEERVQERTRQLNEANCALLDEISERKQAQAELKATKELFERLFDAAPDPTFLIDKEGKINRINQQAVETFGYTFEELLRQDIEILLPAGSRLKHRDLRTGYWKAPARHPMGIEGDIFALKKGGEAFPVDVTLNPVNLSDDLQVICVLHDITQRRQIAAELAEVQRHLMDSVEMERKRLAQELHDGPMQEIYGLIYQLADQGEPELSIKPELAVEIRNKLNDINETLRTISRDLRPPAAQFGLERAIREHADRFKEEHPELQISLDMMPDHNLLSEPVRVTLYRIYQVAITNVLRHAKSRQITVRFLLQADQILLEVEDDGTGFVVPRRWVGFAREGHLGLAGAAERAEAIGGRLEVESELNKGTRVRVIVPQERRFSNP